MSRAQDLTTDIAARVSEAAGTGTTLAIRGGGSKAFHGRATVGEPLELADHRGVVSYEPTELVLTARAGTPLAELEALLAESGQMLAFEPPHFGGPATLGGAVAAGLSGPRRPFAGAVRDLVLGTRIVNGKGEVLRFGGEVMKNVAGYDLSRPMAGALGTLGVLLEVSLKVLPRPETEQTLRAELSAENLFERTEAWLRQGIPLSAATHDGEAAYLRLSGAASAVEAGSRAIDGERIDEAGNFWRDLRDQRLPFFATDSGPPLWRLALPPGSELPALDGPRIVDWAGRQLWLRSDAEPATVRHEAERLGGHATLFRGGDREGAVFHPPGPGLMALHRRLKAALDPAGILNPGRLYAEL